MKSENSIFEEARQTIRGLKELGLPELLEKPLPTGLLGVSPLVSKLLDFLRTWHESIRDAVSEIDLSKYNPSQLGDLWIRGVCGLWLTVSYADKLEYILDCFVFNKTIEEGQRWCVTYLCRMWLGVFALREGFRRLDERRLFLSKWLFEMYLFGVEERPVRLIMRKLHNLTSQLFLDVERLKHHGYKEPIDFEKESLFNEILAKHIKQLELRGKQSLRGLFEDIVQGKPGGFLKKRVESRINSEIKKQQKTQKRIPTDKLERLDKIVGEDEDGNLITLRQILEGEDPGLQTPFEEPPNEIIPQMEQRLKLEIGKFALPIIRAKLADPEATDEEIAQTVGCHRNTVGEYFKKFRRKRKLIASLLR